MSDRRHIELAVYYGPMDNYLCAGLRVGNHEYRVEIGRWSRPPEQADAYDYLAREALAKARRDEKLSNADRVLLFAFENKIRERKRLLKEVKKIEEELGANNL